MCLLHENARCCACIMRFTGLRGLRERRCSSTRLFTIAWYSRRNSGHRRVRTVWLLSSPSSLLPPPFPSSFIHHHHRFHHEWLFRVTSQREPGRRDKIRPPILLLHAVNFFRMVRSKHELSPPLNVFPENQHHRFSLDSTSQLIRSCTGSDSSPTFLRILSNRTASATEWWILRGNRSRILGKCESRRSPDMTTIATRPHFYDSAAIFRINRQPVDRRRKISVSTRSFASNRIH